VAGRRVLDAACGPGLYAAELARRGAQEVGFDNSLRPWLAPLETTCAEFAEAGFLIERLLEPRPLPGGAAVDPARYHRLISEPTGFIAFRLRPSG
jgi:SAM-dependent methyltransferase